MNHPANFDKLARVYRWMEYLSFGPLLMRCRKQFIPQFAHARHALILGDGDGRFTAALLRANLNLRVDAVDASPAMLSALLRAAGKNQMRVRTHCADLRSWQTQNPGYDLVVSHFLLDCFSTDEVTQLIVRILPSLEKGAIWIVSDFALPERRIQRAFANLLISFLYRTFGLLTGLKTRNLPDYASALNANGFQLVMVKTRLFGILRSELWQYLR